MDRMGHDSERAAMIYLHGSDERQHQIADALSKLTKDELKRGSKRGHDEAIGHATGTEPETGVMKINSQSPETGPDLHRKGSAPSATRTRDLLLRRQLLCPLSYRVRPGQATFCWPDPA